MARRHPKNSSPVKKQPPSGSPSKPPPNRCGGRLNQRHVYPRDKDYRWFCPFSLGEERRPLRPVIRRPRLRPFCPPRPLPFSNPRTLKRTNTGPTSPPTEN
jgi:hypothetical protein